MGVRLVNLEDGVELLAIDKNVEEEGEEAAEAVATGAVDGPAAKIRTKSAEADIAAGANDEADNTADNEE